MAYQKTDRSTMHGLPTPHGLGVPHRYPVKSGQSNTDIFSVLARQLYPTGRAWYMKKNSIFERWHQAVNRSFIRILEDSLSILDSTFPDNINFNENDCTLWEYRLGLITNTSLTVEQRRQSIRRKMAYPANVKPRQSRSFIEHELQSAGFDVWVHENLPPYQTPDEVALITLVGTQHGGDTQHGGGTVHGSTGFEVIANSSEPNESFTVGGGNLWATFFIGGEILGETANVPQSRLREFKELVLKLKPAEKVAYTFINYT